jgi:hypothetical protein
VEKKGFVSDCRRLVFEVSRSDTDKVFLDDDQPPRQPGVDRKSLWIATNVHYRL